MTTPTTTEQDLRAQWERRQAAASRITPEQREWQINKLLPAVIACLRDAADAVNADAGKDAAGKDAADKPAR